VPLEMGGGAVWLGLLQNWPRPVASVPARGSSAYASALALTLLVALWAASAFAPLRTGAGKDLVLAVGAIIIWLQADGTPRGVMLGTVAAFAGTAFEVLLVARGVFIYLPSHANLLGVPSWLPWLYFAASAAVGNCGRFLLRVSR
jgi:hypothetical protein